VNGYVNQGVGGKRHCGRFGFELGPVFYFCHISVSPLIEIYARYRAGMGGNCQQPGEIFCRAQLNERFEVKPTHIRFWFLWQQLQRYGWLRHGGQPNENI